MRHLLILTALLFALPAHAVTIDWVTIGDAGNAADPATGSLYGAVPYDYLIGKYEVTNAEYAEFLNAVADADPNGLYNTLMDPNTGDPLGGITRIGSSSSYTYTAVSGRENKPVVFVSFFDAQRFANWLHNGQPSGAQGPLTTEDGAYTFAGAPAVGPVGPSRNPGADFFLPSEDEWYKAAYYDVSALSYNPYPFADGFNGAACEVPAGTTSHSANCNNVVGNTTDVGAYTGSPSEYGTFDQGGNVWEWNEAIIAGPLRGIRGGVWGASPTNLAASDRGFGVDPPTEVLGIGFRVAMIPEPSTALLLAGGLLGVALRKRPSA